MVELTVVLAFGNNKNYFIPGYFPIA